jgi:hypothetical protein
MRSDEYCRIHAACLAMAKQPGKAEVQARWLAMAEVWLKRATEQHERSLSRGVEVEWQWQCGDVVRR